jgi:iron complex transport system ATP-binding protein
LNNNYQISNLKFKYSKYDFEFEIEELSLHMNMLTCIIGPNGSGKSTFLKLCAGKESQYSGRIMLKNKNLNDYKPAELAKTTSYLPQEYDTGQGYLVEDIVMMGRYPYQGRSFFSSREDKAKVFDALKKTGGYKLLNRDFFRLSGGERKRVLIASVLAQESDFILLDEPSASLDITGQADIFSILTKIKDTNKGIVAATHNINLASVYSDYIIVFKNGSILKSGRPEDVITKEILSEAYNTEIEVTDHPFLKNRKFVFTGKEKGLNI